MDLGGIVLDEWFGGAECREMRSEGSASTVMGAKVMFKVGGQGEGTIKGKAVSTGTSGGGSRWEVVTSTKGAAGMCTWTKSGGGGGRWEGGVDRSGGGGGRRRRRGRRGGNGGSIGVEEVINFILERERLGGNCVEHAGPEGGEDGAEGGRRGGVQRKICFQSRVDVGVMDHGGETGGELGGRFEGEASFDCSVEFNEELLNGNVCDFGKEAGERNEVNSSLVKRVGEVSGISVRDKARLVCKGKGVCVTVWESM